MLANRFISTKAGNGNNSSNKQSSNEKDTQAYNPPSQRKKPLEVAIELGTPE